MRSAQPLIPQHRFAALTATARFWLVWLIGVVSRIAPLNGSRRLHAYVDRAERWIERLLFVAAVSRVLAPSKRIHRPRSTPTGFRRTEGSTRLLYKSARIRLRNATLAERLAHIAAILEAPERIIAHFIKRLGKLLTRSRLVATTPATDALRARALDAVAFVDSS
jgi:hypothetical protein